MVLLSYQDSDGVRDLYRDVMDASCGRQACSVAILAAHEVDAIASCRMLTTLLKRDNITYSLRPVANYSQVKSCLTEIISSDIKIVFLINCGAVYNISKLLGESSDIRCIILDNHRPTHLANVHSEYQVVVFENEVLINSERELIPPNGDSLSGAESTSNDEDDEDDDDDEEDYIDDDISASDIDGAGVREVDNAPQTMTKVFIHLIPPSFFHQCRMKTLALQRVHFTKKTEVHRMKKKKLILRMLMILIKSLQMVGMMEKRMLTVTVTGVMMKRKMILKLQRKMKMIQRRKLVDSKSIRSHHQNKQDQVDSFLMMKMMKM